MNLPIETDPATKRLARQSGNATERIAPMQTLSRGLKILRYIGSARTLVRLRDVASAFGLDRSIALRLLQTLEIEGYVAKHPSLKAYTLGPAIGDLLQPPSLAERLAERAKPALSALTEATGQTSHIGYLERHRAILSQVHMPSGPIAVQQARGDLEHLHCSAIGKVIYAFLPSAARESLAPDLPLTRFTPTTLTSLEALDAESAIIRARGVAFDRAEGPAPLACIAAPILDDTGLPIAAVGISAIAALLQAPIDQHMRWIEAVQRCASQLSQDLR